MILWNASARRYLEMDDFPRQRFRSFSFPKGQCIFRNAAQTRSLSFASKLSNCYSAVFLVPRGHQPIQFLRFSPSSCVCSRTPKMTIWRWCLPDVVFKMTGLRAPLRRRTGFIVACSGRACTVVGFVREGLFGMNYFATRATHSGQRGDRNRNMCHNRVLKIYPFPKGIIPRKAWRNKWMKNCNPSWNFDFSLSHTLKGQTGCTQRLSV